MLKILALNPGTRYLGLAVFHGPELRDWGIRTFKGRWSRKKLKKIRKVVSGLIRRYGLTTLALKKLHPARSSANLNALVLELQNLAREKGLKVQAYTLQELKDRFKGEKRINKKVLAEIVAREYPAIYREFTKERQNKTPYFYRLFEAVALGATGYYLSEK